MSLKQYQTYILETILKDKNYSKKFESNDFKEIYQEVNPIFCYEMTDAFIESGIKLPESLLQEHESIKLGLPFVSYIGSINNEGVGIEFTIEHGKLGGIVKFIRLSADDKIPCDDYLTLNPSIIKNILNFKNMRLRFIVRDNDMNGFYEDEIKNLDYYNYLQLELVTDDDEIIIQKIFPEYQKNIYKYDENDKVQPYHIDQYNLITTINKIIKNINNIQ